MKAFVVFVLTVILSLVLAKDSELKVFASGTRQFSEAIYDEIIVDNKDNLVVSPFSAETIMALTQSGGVGTTAKEIKTALHLPESEEETEALIKAVLPTFESEDYIVKTANKIYVENNLKIKESFKNVATDVYHAAFQNVEFAENVGAAEIINSWVEEETNNKIRNLISPDDIDASTRAVLVNALYFQANWTSPFAPVTNKIINFRSSNNKVVKADFMSIESAEINYYENQELDAKFIELPFKGVDASMTIILPNKPEGIAVLEKNPRRVFGSQQYQTEFVEVLLPKFKIESTVDFKAVLEKLGVRAAFDPTTVDFSGIAGEPGDITISKIIQKAFVDVNEGGVTAAAATAVVGFYSLPPPPTQHFIADRPFMFYIKVKDIILFEGRVLEPKYD